jgi:uncharacterized membrane protein
MIESTTMSRTDFAALPLALLLAACGSPKSIAPPATGATTESGSAPSSKIPMRGIVSASGDLMTFCACGAPGGTVLTISDSNGELAMAFRSTGATPSHGMYVELEGTPDASGRSVAWTRVVRAHALGEALACNAPVFEGEYIASGHEPSWSIEIRENGIVYGSPELRKGRTYPYAFTRTATGSVVYATKTDAPSASTLEVSLEPATCVDPMSGELRTLKAHVLLDGRKVEGCAAAGVPRGEFGDAPLDELNRFAGTFPHTVRLWNDPVLENRLEALLGPMMKSFLESMKVDGPVTADAGVFYVIGNTPRRDGSNRGFFLADPATNTLAVVLYVNGVRHDFKEGGRDVAPPAEVMKAIDDLERR